MAGNSTFPRYAEAANINDRANTNTASVSGPAYDTTSANWWTEAETALFTQWASAFGTYSDSFNNPYFDYFYTGQDIQVTIDGLDSIEDILPFYSFAYNIQQQKQPIYGYWSYCVDIETEALTNRGWVNGIDLREDDLILSMDPANKQLKWSTIKSIYRNDKYDGKMFKITGCGIDALITPGHKFALTTGELKPIDQISHQDTIQVMGTAIDSSSEVYSDAFVELLGWYITEGHDRKDCNAIEIVQSQKVNPEKLERIEFCLKRLGVNYGKYPPKKGSEVVKLYIGTKQSVVNQLKQAAPNKIPTYDFIFALSTDQRMILIDTMLDGDGSRPGINGRQYGQSRHCVDQLDVLMSLCAMSGIATHKSDKTPNGQTTVTMKVRSVASGQRLDFNGGYVDKRHLPDTAPRPNQPTQDYQGLVWCPETEYGTFVCRRNNRVYVTGNTYDAMLRGTRIISGAFSIISTSPYLLTQQIAKAADVRAKSTEAQRAASFYAIRGLDDDEALINQYWRRNIDSNLSTGQQHLFSIHPPFNFIIRYGLQETSLVTTNPSTLGNTKGMATNSSNTQMLTDYNERLVKNSSYGSLDTQILLENVELVSKQIEFDVEGNPLLETYAFIARDEVLLQPVQPSQLQIYAPDVTLETDPLRPRLGAW